MASIFNGILEDIDDGSSCPYPPWNFSWIIENKLAAMAWPQNSENLEYLVEEGIKHLVTLSAEKQPPISEFNKKQKLLDWTLIDVEEFEPPTLNDIKEFIEICERSQEKNEAVGVHCRMGRGRTGVMLACYLVRFENLAPATAISNIRLQRPGSVETPEQERAVVRYHDCLRGTKVSEI